jgi:ribosomal protein S18 acetylase RimI-like enzyme
MLKIKKLTSNDSKVAVKLFDDYRIFYEQNSNIDGAEVFLKERLLKNEAHIFVAFISDSEKPVGFTLLYPKFSSVSIKRNFHLGDLYVAIDYRKKGIAEALMQTAKKFAIEQMASSISLNTALDNFSAQKLYEKLGYKKQGQIFEFFHYQLDL